MARCRCESRRIEQTERWGGGERSAGWALQAVAQAGAQAARQLMRVSCCARCRVYHRPLPHSCTRYTHQGALPRSIAAPRPRGKSRDGALTSVVHLGSAGSGSSLTPGNSLLRRFT